MDVKHMAKRLTKPKILRVLHEHGVYVKGFKWVNLLFDKISAEDIEGDELGTNPRGHGSKSEWSTYDECVHLHISAAKGKIILDYTIYNSDELRHLPGGHSLRFNRIFVIPGTYSHLFRDIASTRLQRAADDAWAKHIRQWKRDWVENF